MIQVRQLEIKNFKSLYHTTIETFGRVNFFYGYNNSGKSNIFRILKLIFQRKFEGTSVSVKDDGSEETTQIGRLTNFWSGYILNDPYLFSKNDRTNPIEFRVVLEVDNRLLPDIESLQAYKYVGRDVTLIVIEGAISSITSENSFLQVMSGTMNGNLFYKCEDRVDAFFQTRPRRKGEKETVEIDRQTGPAILRLFNDLILYIDSDRSFTKEIAKDGVNDIDVKTFKNSLFELFINAEKNKSFNELTKFLSGFTFTKAARKLLKTNINSFPFNEDTDIGFAKFGSEMEVMLTNNTARLPLKNFGTGIQQFLFILAKIHFNKSRIVIVEEIELNLSPLYQKELLLFLRSLMPELFSQLHFSSHSPYFTQKDAVMVDVVQHVQIDDRMGGGTSVDSHDDIASINDPDADFFYFRAD